MAWANLPPPLAIPSHRPPSQDSEDSSRSPSPVLTSLDSSSALILVHDSDDNNAPFDFTTDDEDDDNTPRFEVRRASIPPLGPSVVFLYLLSPYLKLGAFFLPHTMLPLKHGLPSFLLFAGLSSFARHIWYKLARYMRTADLEDVILDAFARGRGKERHRSILRSTVRAGTGALRVLLAAVYLRRAAHVLLPLLPNLTLTSARIASTVALSLVVFPLLLAQSLASKRVVYATWLSLITYIAWLGFVTYAHMHDALRTSSSSLRLGIFWEGITAIAFAFTSSSTLPLYASLKGTTQPISTVKTSRTRSFRILSVLSVALAILLTLPLIIFSANPNSSEPLASILPLSSIAAPVLNAATLLLGIPSIIVTTPPLPIPERIRHASTIPISKTLLYTLVVVLALLSEQVSSILNDVLLISALFSTYFLPAVVHITAHFFKRPLTIVVPQAATPPTPAARDGSGSTLASPQSARPDELLLRKERALQRKQFKRRIVWDVGVWGMFVWGGVGLVWAVGRVARRW